MKVPGTSIVSLLLLSMLLWTGQQTDAAMPQDGTPKSPEPSRNSSGQMSMLIVDEVRHQLRMLPYYGVFDWLECEMNAGNTAILRGQVTRPTIKSDAEATLRKIEGIRNIDNQIEVLPISPGDDQIRIAVYRSIFRYDGPLFRYAIQGTLPIHIIVNNGRVTLKGVVDSASDSQLAYMAANGISGVFEVKNELNVVNPKKD